MMVFVLERIVGDASSLSCEFLKFILFVACAVVLLVITLQ